VLFNALSGKSSQTSCQSCHWEPCPELDSQESSDKDE